MRFWDDALKEWAVPPEVVTSAPASPYGFDAKLCDQVTEWGMTRDTVSRQRAREALPDGGSVLDVGCGAGVASLSLGGPDAHTGGGGPRLGHAVGVDEQLDMLDGFARRATGLGVAHEEVQGRWPDVANTVGPADVVVCHHVLFNVAALEPFATALDSHARHRVVIEIPYEHPLIWLTPLWRRLHDLGRPTRPTADDALAALRELGFDATMQRWDEPSSPWRLHGDALVEHVRRRLCLPADRDAEILGLLQALGLPRDGRPMATIWWPTTSPIPRNPH